MLPYGALKKASLGLIFATFLGAVGFASPSSAVIKHKAPVRDQELLVTSAKSQIRLSDGSYQLELVGSTNTQPFSLVGVTWDGVLVAKAYFQVRVHENSAWTPWTSLSDSPDHDADPTSLEALSARSGTDPLLTGEATGIQVRLRSPSSALPRDLRISLINSQVSSSDRALMAIQHNAVANTSNVVISPTGAVVAKPRIISRADWGADETWRDAHLKYGTKIIAGFIHHTAGVANYTPEESPGIVRGLYYYYTHTKGYADIAYNYFVDKYGTIYEGRANCNLGATCTDNSPPVIGAHTAGMNLNTFAVSVMGNFETTPVSAQEAAAISSSVAQVMAWKIAPYGLDPNATARVPSNDTSGLSKYKSGTVASTPVISAHRDVGLTACPGKYLYPYVPAIREQISTLLIPVLQKVDISPTLIDSSSSAPVTVGANLPANATWTVDVVNEDDGSLVFTNSALQAAAGRLSYTWNRVDNEGNPVPVGTYAVVISATVGTVDLPPRSSLVTVSEKPHPVNEITFIRRDAKRTVVGWSPSTEESIPLAFKAYRFSQDGGKTWTPWKRTIRDADYFVGVSWKKGVKYTVQVRLRNALGYSAIVERTYKPRR